MIGYIYKLTSPTGRIYIGQTNDITRRLKEHKKNSKKQTTNGSVKLNKSLKKHGWDRFKVEILFKGECTYDLLNDLEIHYIRIFNTFNSEKGLNLMAGVFNGKHSDETKYKISVSAKKLLSNKEYSFKRNSHWIGRKHSDETKEKMSKAKRGKKLPKEWAEKIRLSMLKKGGKLVLNKETGIYYHGVKEACFSINLAHSTLRNKLNGQKRNNTQMEYV